MSRRRRVAGVALGLLAGSAAAAPLLAQSADDPPRSFPVTAAVVTVDVVVRDREGQVVRDLAADDFEVYEDGEPQALLSFEVVSRGRAAVPGSPPDDADGAPPPGPGPPPALVALVFDRLTPGARALARRAARAYVDSAQETGGRVGVFSIGLSLRTEQAFTDHGESLRAAIDRAVDASTAIHDSARDRIRDLTESVDAFAARGAAGSGNRGSGPAAGGAAAAAGSGSGQAAAEAMLLGMELRMLRTLEGLERDQQGYATMNGLLAVVNALRLHPGRKTAVVFSEGLAVAPNVEPKFRALIDAANRGNVAIYTMDAAGLRAESTTSETRREMMAAAQAQIQQRSSGRDDFRGAMTKELERNEDRLRLDPHSGLGDLARETGGFLVRDTNDLAAAAARIEEEIRFHYLLSYTPTDGAHDGRFRRIEVRAKRPGARVQARAGYFALRAADPWPVLPYEAPALALLEQEPPPAALPVRTLGLSCPQPGRPGLVPVLVEIPGDALSFEVDEEREQYRGDFTILARVRDAAGGIVERVSHHYALSGPAADLDRARGGEVLFYRELELLPGRYSLDAVAHDRLAGTAGVARAVVEVPPGDGTRMSSLVVVKRIESVTSGASSHPLQFGETLLYPNLGEPIHKSGQDKLALFITGLVGARVAVRATLEVLQGGESRGRAPLELPIPDDQGRLQHVAGIPIEGFPAGDYQLKVTLAANGSSATRVASISVRE